MLFKYSDVNFNEENKKIILKTIQIDTTVSNKAMRRHFLLIDWRGADVSTIDFKWLVDNDYDEKYINDREVVKAFYRFRETPNEEYLWNKLVEDERVISNELYLKNTYEENLEILCKVRVFMQVP